MIKPATFVQHSDIFPHLSPQHIAPYILSTLASYHENRRVATLQNIIDDVGACKTDVRVTLRELHQRGFVDALRMKLTLQGFALAMAIKNANLPPLPFANTCTAAT